jgi:hypothetical protein
MKGDCNERINNLNFKTYFEVVDTKTVCSWHRNGKTFQWRRIESPGIDPDINIYLFCFVIFVFVFKTGSHYVAQAGFELTVFLPSTKCWE